MQASSIKRGVVCEQVWRRGSIRVPSGDTGRALLYSQRLPTAVRSRFPIHARSSAGNNGVHMYTRRIFCFRAS